MPSEALVEQYRDALIALLPPGDALGRELASEVVDILTALAVEPARIHERGLALLDEADPSTATELIADWESLFELPDTCAPATTIEGQRASIVLRLVGTGGHSRGDYIALAAVLGYAAPTFAPYQPFTAGSSAGDALTNDEWANAVLVTVESNPANDALLECVFNRQRRAHGTLIFDWVP